MESKSVLKRVAVQTAAKKEFAVIWRKGGTANFEWMRVLDNFTREEAEAKAAEINRMGFATHIHKADLLDTVGLPETFE